MITFNIKGQEIEITPTIQEVYGAVVPFEHKVSTNKLKYPVAGSCLVEYENVLNIPFKRIHNIYIENVDEGYFIDVLDNKVYLEDLSKYNISDKYGVFPLYTVDKIFKNIEYIDLSLTNS